MQQLRTKDYFKKANIGQDNTNTYNSTIRITETCFIGKTKHRFNTMEHNEAREVLYQMVDDIGHAISSVPLEEEEKDVPISSSSPSLSLSTSKSQPVVLDDTLTELLYAYYPHGGYYRTHMDAIPNSISFLRQYSFLLYLNGGDGGTDDTTNTTNNNNNNNNNTTPPTNNARPWNTTIDGGQLRLYLKKKHQYDSTSSTRRTLDFTNDQYQKEYDTTLDVTPTNGTLVLFNSHTIPHEVLNTYRERYVIIGWFNRPLSLWNPNEYTNLISRPVDRGAGGGSGSGDVTATPNTNHRMTLLAISMGMITFGLYHLIIASL
jgi:Rps23 Pro-64 3,4-dihydroxylase Tpa1-like proline 4-hydroxylase